ncbi:hypothetical protein D6T64_08295 [Cryobacterium melibiosiphilum]|uniref:Uncharacterized protein n=1 Tax=Cryobacterium melibiosiphilum TaxID=995039 RepID=A0A3A5MT25_9MICO|nr:DUF6220 domain-containing protein [Cryobacterium melibiosiphilum]RJT89096.1 hypothetical protein D6T64_08295 [Cryobacterium melibiosiphilum]
MRKVFAVLSVLLTASLVLQFYLAAVGVFSDPEDELFALHGTNGRIVLPILALLVLLAAVFARAGRRVIWLSALPLILVLFQTVLFIVVGAAFGLTEEDQVIPLAATLVIALHAIVGLTAFFVATMLIRRSWPGAFPRQGAGGEPALVGASAPVGVTDAAARSAEPVRSEPVRSEPVQPASERGRRATRDDE